MSLLEELHARRAELYQEFKSGTSGLTLVGNFTETVDKALVELFQEAHARLSRERTGEAKPCVFAAVGGYGRRELFPYSDLDLLFIYSAESDSYIEGIAQAVLYSLWDSGLEVGHSIRSLGQ